MIFKIREIFNGALSEESGQSLVEILIALTIGAILIGAASTAVVIVLQSNTTSQRQQSATTFAQEYLLQARAYTSAGWHKIYSLNKGSSTKYYFESTSTEVIAATGTEGVIDNNIRQGMIGHWKLDESTTTIAYDSSSNDNDGVLTNSPTRATSTNCKVARCLSFSGSDQYVDISSSDSSYDSTDITVSVWANADSGNSGWIIGEGHKYRIRISPGSDADWWVRETSNGDSNQISGGNISANTWYHVVGIYNSSAGEQKLFINGSLAASSTPGFTLDAGDDNQAIGSGYTTSPNDFNGRIDDVRIYNRALSDKSVQNLYNSASFSRYFYVENVCRTNDSNYDIAGVTPCSGGQVEDPSTQKVTVVVEWDNGSSQISIEDYVTRWRNDAFVQSDWSGGSGEEGPFDGSTNKYSSSTDISTSTGSIKIEGI